MEIKAVPLGHIQTNCYMLSGEKGAILIDPGFKSEITKNFLDENKDKERLVLLTHAHFDHIGGAPFLREDTGVKIAIGKDEAKNLTNPLVNLSLQFHAKFGTFNADLELEDGQEITVGDLTFKVIFASGHTTGGVVYLFDGVLFSGDTLFYESVGRTDFPGGDFTVLENSVRKLYSLPDSTTVFPGHGPETTIGHEKKFNPYVRSL